MKPIIKTSTTPVEFYWHYQKRIHTSLVLVWDGLTYHTNDIIFHQNLSENPMRSVWHPIEPRLTCNGKAYRMEILPAKNGMKVAHIY